MFEGDAVREAIELRLGRKIKPISFIKHKSQGKSYGVMNFKDTKSKFKFAKYSKGNLKFFESYVHDYMDYNNNFSMHTFNDKDNSWIDSTDIAKEHIQNMKKERSEDFQKGEVEERGITISQNNTYNFNTYEDKTGNTNPKNGFKATNELEESWTHPTEGFARESIKNVSVTNEQNQSLVKKSPYDRNWNFKDWELKYPKRPKWHNNVWKKHAVYQGAAVGIVHLAQGGISEALAQMFKGIGS